MYSVVVVVVVVPVVVVVVVMNSTATPLRASPDAPRPLVPSAHPPYQPAPYPQPGDAVVLVKYAMIHGTRSVPGRIDTTAGIRPRPGREGGSRGPSRKLVYVVSHVS